LVVEGNVGIGVSDPTGKLIVRGTGTTTGVGLQTQNSSGTALVTMLDNGNVGIGTTNPGSYRLNVNGNAYVGGGSGVTATIFRDLNTAYFLNPDAGSQFSQSAAILGSVSIGDSFDWSSGSILSVRRDSTAANLSAIFVMDNVGYGIISNGGNTGVHGDGGSEGVSGYGGFNGVRARCTNTPNCYDFWGEGPKTYFDGNVGVGQMNPSQKLDVNGNVRANGYNLCYQVSCQSGGGSWMTTPGVSLGQWTADCNGSDVTSVKIRIYVCP
jgi:hypothetical protein